MCCTKAVNATCDTLASHRPLKRVWDRGALLFAHSEPYPQRNLRPKKPKSLKQATAKGPTKQNTHTHTHTHTLSLRQVGCGYSDAWLDERRFCCNVPMEDQGTAEDPIGTTNGCPVWPRTFPSQNRKDMRELAVLRRLTHVVRMFDRSTLGGMKLKGSKIKFSMVS